jgi:hypothetical protein
MAQRALVYKTGSTAEHHVYVGQTQFTSTLHVNATNSYLHNGAWEVVHMTALNLRVGLPTPRLCLPYLSARSPRRNLSNPDLLAVVVPGWML